MVRKTLSDIVDFINKPRFFVVCADGDKIIFIPPSSLAMINPRYFDNYFDYDFVDCRENKSVDYDFKNILFMEEFGDRSYESSIGVSYNVTEATHSGHIQDEHVVLIHNQLVSDSALDVRPSDGPFPNIQPSIESIQLSDGSVIISRNNKLQKCMHSTTQPTDTEDSVEWKIGADSTAGIKNGVSVGRKKNNGKASFHCDKCGKWVSEE